MIKITIKVEGMMCGMCEAHVNDAINKEFKVKKVSSSSKKNETIIISEKEIDSTLLKDTIEKTGYKATSISSEPYKKKWIFG